MLLPERAELRDECLVAPEPEVRVDTQFDRLESLVLEPGDGRLRERLVLEVLERSPAPQRQRFAKLLRRARGIAARERRSTLVDEPAEAVEIELSLTDADDVARSLGDDDLRPFRQRAPQT